VPLRQLSLLLYLDVLLGEFVDGCSVLTADTDDVLETLSSIIVVLTVHLGQHQDHIDTAERLLNVRRHHHLCPAATAAVRFNNEKTSYR